MLESIFVPLAMNLFSHILEDKQFWCLFQKLNARNTWCDKVFKVVLYFRLVYRHM